jgi:leader peptidase (prepilin peptidase)/N-methyltransferase
VPSLHGFSGDNGVVNAARSLAFSLTGLMAGSGLVLWVAVVAETVLRKEAMGFADVTLAGAIGAFCGWQGAVFALFGGAVAGVVWIGLACAVSGIFRVRRSAVLPAENEGGERVEPGFGARVPFGPMLAAGALLHVLVASEAVAAHFARAAALLGL